MLNKDSFIKVSIIMPLYNAAPFVQGALESVLAQSYPYWELLVIDDASNDASVTLVTEFMQEDPRIRLLKFHENCGAAVARNRGLQEARGRYIAFLDSDDRWLPHKLEVQLGCMESSRLPFTYSAYYRINEAGEKIATIGVPAKVSYRDMLKTCYVGCLTAMYDTAIFGKVEMPLIRRRQDYALWLRLLKRVEFAYGINEPLALYRVRAGSISSNKASTSLYNWKIYRDIEELTFPYSIYLFSQYAIRGVLRSRFPWLAQRLGILHTIKDYKIN